MSIREDARNDRIVREVLGYDPQRRVEQLKREVRELEMEVRRLKGIIKCFNGSDK